MCDTRIISNAETLVCEAVNKAFEALRPGAAKVTADGLYDKKGNVLSGCCTTCTGFRIPR